MLWGVPGHCHRESLKSQLMTFGPCTNIQNPMSAKSNNTKTKLLKLLILVTPWYLSSVGGDTLSCGKTRETPCQTLPKLLTLAYNQTKSTSIDIITDVDLTFDEGLLVSYGKSFRTCKICFKNISI